MRYYLLLLRIRSGQRLMSLPRTRSSLLLLQQRRPLLKPKPKPKPKKSPKHPQPRKSLSTKDQGGRMQPGQTSKEMAMKQR